MEPKTNFPSPPKDRWTGWIGFLESGDESYIFTESVCRFLFFQSRYVIEFREDPYISESIFDVFRKIQKICRSPDSEEREIRKSIKSRLLFLLNFYVRRRFQKRKEKWEKERVIEDKLMEMKIPVSGESEMTLFWKEEFHRVFYQSLSLLSDLQKNIVERVLLGHTISRIARDLESPRSLIDREMKIASSIIDKNCAEKGMDIYRS
ncbi:MAG: hypothetical protein H7A24_09875 [Leptospiraceae bacterium]|nr:hypothetical protein [Leptospiraceae bacterium]MCP5512177.1 hypothetical protein [Leptospiraceae bacterium]